MSDESLVAEARDQSTSAVRLAQLAHEHPETRAAVAGNPTAYPGLLAWLAAVNDPAVNQVLHRRSAASDPEVTLPPAPAAVVQAAPAAVTPVAQPESLVVTVPDAPVPASGIADTPRAVATDTGPAERTGWQKAGAALDTAGNVANGVASVITKIYGLGLILVAIIAVCVNPAAFIWPALLIGGYGVYLVLPGDKWVVY
jgi:hypothetical protein